MGIIMGRDINLPFPMLIHIHTPWTSHKATQKDTLAYESEANRMQFFMVMNPPTATAQEKKVSAKYGKTCVYEEDRVKAARQKLLAHLEKHAPDVPMSGPLKLLCIWQWQAPRLEDAGTYRTSKPDTDNVQKLLKDCMTKCGFWFDDAQVADDRCIKKWAPCGEYPGIFVYLEAANEQE